MYRPRFYYAPDDGAAAGTTSTATTATAEAGQQGTSATTKNTDQPGPIPYERFAEVNEKYRAAQAKIAEHEKAQSDAKKAADAAEKARLAEQGKYQELAEAAEKRAADLEPYKAKSDRYEAALTKLLTQERKDLPKHVLTLLDKLDPADQLDYIAENREVLTAKQTPPNINGTAGAGGAAAVDPKAREAELRARFRI